MSTKVHVKFCGLRSAADIAAAVAANARYVGFVFFPKYPRNVSIEEATALALWPAGDEGRGGRGCG